GRGAIRAAAVPVRDRGPIGLRDRLAAERIALAAVLLRRMVVDGQGAELRDRLRLAMREVRLLADEVFALHLPPRHVGFDDGVIRIELEAERAVGLLEAAGRPVDADAGGDDPVRLPRFPHSVPELRAVLERDVELPAEIADVREP